MTNPKDTWHTARRNLIGPHSVLPPGHPVSRHLEAGAWGWMMKGVVWMLIGGLLFLMAIGLSVVNYDMSRTKPAKLTTPDPRVTALESRVTTLESRMTTWEEWAQRRGMRY